MVLPTLFLKNQFGEVSENFVLGGSSSLACNFVVDHTNGNGLGVRSVKGAGIANVFMNTSATPLGGNPNPIAGLILIQLKAGYSGYQSGSYGFDSPLSGSPVTSTTTGHAYVIVSLGTTTGAQWLAAGLPSGVAPAVGASFVAIATGAIGGTGAVEVQSSSGIMSIELVGDPNQSSAPSIGGAWILSQCLNASSALTAPADGTVIGLNFVMNGTLGQL